jgi:hypothetical protein
MAEDKGNLTRTDGNSAVDDFLAKLADMPNAKPAAARGRLLFAMDATASREPSWDIACQIQGDMFAEAAKVGGLDVQLCYYRGYKDFRATPWVSSSAKLINHMTNVRCLGGYTQLRRVLRYAAQETQKTKINALVFVGDALEEDADAVCNRAGELGLLGVPCFMFQEGGNARVTSTFKQVAELTKGAYCSFDVSSAYQLSKLLSAVAVYAAGGRGALEDFSKGAGPAVLQITDQLRRSSKTRKNK